MSEATTKTVSIPVPDPAQLGGVLAPYAPATGVSVLLLAVYSLVRFDQRYPQIRPAVSWFLRTPKAAHMYLIGIAVGWCEWANRFQAMHTDPVASAAGSDVRIQLLVAAIGGLIVTVCVGIWGVRRVLSTWLQTQEPVEPAPAAPQSAPTPPVTPVATDTPATARPAQAAAPRPMVSPQQLGLVSSRLSSMENTDAAGVAVDSNGLVGSVDLILGSKPAIDRIFQLAGSLRLPPVAVWSPGGGSGLRYRLTLDQKAVVECLAFIGDDIGSRLRERITALSFPSSPPVA